MWSVASWRSSKSTILRLHRLEVVSFSRAPAFGHLSGIDGVRPLLTDQPPPPRPPRLRHLGGQPVQAVMVGLSVPMLGGPPSWAERLPALIHRPNSGSRPTPPETAFQRHSGTAAPPPAWCVVVAAPTRNVQFAGIGHQVSRFQTSSQNLPHNSLASPGGRSSQRGFSCRGGSGAGSSHSGSDSGRPVSTWRATLSARMIFARRAKPRAGHLREAGTWRRKTPHPHLA